MSQRFIFQCLNGSFIILKFLVSIHSYISTDKITIQNIISEEGKRGGFMIYYIVHDINDIYFGVSSFHTTTPNIVT